MGKYKSYKLKNKVEKLLKAVWVSFDSITEFQFRFRRLARNLSRFRNEKSLDSTNSGLGVAFIQRSGKYITGK
jgi:hypothetical protein